MKEANGEFFGIDAYQILSTVTEKVIQRSRKKASNG